MHFTNTHRQMCMSVHVCMAVCVHACASEWVGKSEAFVSGKSEVNGDVSYQRGAEEATLGLGVTLSV